MAGSGDWVSGKFDSAVNGAAVESEIGSVIGECELSDLTKAIVVIHRGKLVAEAYAEGVDHNTTLISWSMAKSITHALVGIAKSDGLIDVAGEAPIAPWQGDDRRAITLQNLLEMRSGLSWVEDYVDSNASDVIAMLFGSGAQDNAKYAIERPLASEPGSEWIYSSGTTNIITRVLGDALGDVAGSENIARFIQRRLFDPLGMTSATIRCDDAGTFVGSSYVFATARDFARFGLLYLSDGLCGVDRVLPAGWVGHARHQTVLDTETNLGYGAHWWTLPGEEDSLMASGYEGQYIVVVPHRELVVVRLGKTVSEKRPNVLASLRRIIEAFPFGAHPMLRI